MKKTLSLMMMAALFAGSVGCSSTPKQEDMSEPTTEVASLEEDDTTEMPVEEPAPTTSNSDSDLSLGAGSSGRGH